MKYKEMGIDTRIADFHDPDKLAQTFQGADTAKNFPFCSDGMVTFGRAIRMNQMNTFTNDFEELTGQKPMTVRAIFEDMDNHLIGSRTSTDN